MAKELFCSLNEVLIELFAFFHLFLLLVHSLVINILDHSLHVDYLILLSVAVVQRYHENRIRDQKPLYSFINQPCRGAWAQMNSNTVMETSSEAIPLRS